MRTPRFILIWSLLFMCFVSFGCKNDAPPPPSKEATTIDKKESLEEKVARLQTQLLILQMDVAGMSDGGALVSTEEKGYSIAQTKYGSFSIVCDNATQYLDGYKVRLRIGNLTNARFNGAKVGVQWASFKNSKEVSVTDTFFPGRYTAVELVLTPANPEDIKTFSVTLKFDQLALIN